MAKCKNCGHEDVQNFAGGTPEEPVAAAPQVEPSNAPEPVVEAPVAERAPASDLAPQAPEAQAAPVEQQAPIEQGGQTPVDPELAADPDYQKTYQDLALEKKKYMAEQNYAFDQDLANGHIEPKTYHQLFADQGTLGRIGTLFGLLVGGAGAGLSHQPNAVLGMIDKEIQRDYDAQVKSKENAQNFLRINQNAAHTKGERFALSQSQMYQTSFHYLLNKVKNMNPQQQSKYMNVLMTLYPEMKSKINNIEDLGAAAAAAQGINVFNQPNQGQATPGKPQGSAGKGKGGNQASDDSGDHILKPGAQASFMRAQYNPQYNQDGAEVKDQLAKAALADKAVDAINKHFTELSANVKNIAHRSGNYQPVGAGLSGNTVSDAARWLGDKASDASGWVHRQAEGFASVPYIGEAISSSGKMITNTAKNRDYDVHRDAISSALANVLTSSGLTPTQAQGVINDYLPEVGDDMSMLKSKLKTLKEKIKTATPTNALERHGLSRSAGK